MLAFNQRWWQYSDQAPIIWWRAAAVFCYSQSSVDSIPSTLREITSWWWRQTIDNDLLPTACCCYVVVITSSSSSNCFRPQELLPLSINGTAGTLLLSPRAGRVFVRNQNETWKCETVHRRRKCRWWPDETALYGSQNRQERRFTPSLGSQKRQHIVVHLHNVIVQLQHQQIHHRRFAFHHYWYKSSHHTSS